MLQGGNMLCIYDCAYRSCRCYGRYGCDRCHRRSGPHRSYRPYRRHRRYWAAYLCTTLAFAW